MLNDLEKQNLITTDEKNTIKETGKVTIGKKAIIFENRIELESYISVEDDGVYILVNFKGNNYYIYASNILDGKTEDEMMDMFVESEKYYASDYYEEEYPGREIDKDLVLEDYGVESLLELALDSGFDTIEEMLIVWECVKPEEFQLKKIEGELTDPNGNVVQVNPYTNLKYEITKDATYAFIGKTSDGDIVNLNIPINIGNKYKLIQSDDYANNISKFGLIDGYKKNIDILEEYNPKMKLEGSEEEIDLIPAIDNGIICLWEIDSQLPDQLPDVKGKNGFATIYLTINGQKITFSIQYTLDPR